MSVHEIQCGSLVVYFCMVNSVIKKVDTIFSDLGGFETQTGQ